MSKAKAADVNAAAYSKDRLLRSTRYSHHEKDVLAAVLQDGQAYTHEQAAQAVADFLKRRVIN